MLDGQHQRLYFLLMPQLLTRASCKKDWKRISDESSLMVLRQPNQSRDWTELYCWRFVFLCVFTFYNLVRSFNALVVLQLQAFKDSSCITTAHLQRPGTRHWVSTVKKEIIFRQHFTEIISFVFISFFSCIMIIIIVNVTIVTIIKCNRWLAEYTKE